MRPWPASAEELEREQREIALRSPPDWSPAGEIVAAGCFVASRGDRLWAACGEEFVVRGSATGPYAAGLLALREGPVLEEAVSALGEKPDVLLVNATGRDHPRRCGLALHLGSRVDLPTIGVTDRPLIATCSEPGAERGSAEPLMLGDDLVGYVVRTRAGARPVLVHAAWRTEPDTALEVILRCAGRARTPQPIRAARHAARTARARDTGGSGGEPPFHVEGRGHSDSGGPPEQTGGSGGEPPFHVEGRGHFDSGGPPDRNGRTK